MQTADQLAIDLQENGWKPSEQFPNTGKWSFLEMRGWLFLGVVCVVREGLASEEEIKSILSYLKNLMPNFSIKTMDLVIVFA